MKRIYLILSLMLLSTVLYAQNRRITGTLMDNETSEAMMQATVQLLRQDSSFVAGTVTASDGRFSVAAPKSGKYILKVSSVGYLTTCTDVEVKGKSETDLGVMKVKPDAVMLKETSVVAQAAKVTVKEDTFIYNASAYRTPEGSVVEELIKKLPGAEVGDDGKITINGKEVKKILVDGKEFMTGDTKTAMKNLPTSMIDNIKAYDQKSDLARVSGIDDGEEETVLDFGVKKGMNKGLFGNLDLSYGTRDRYAERLMGSLFTDNHRVMFFGNFNNVNDMGFPGGGGRGRWGNRDGLNTKKFVGLNYNYEKKDKLKVDMSSRWNRTDTDKDSWTSTEYFSDVKGKYANSNTLSYQKQNQFNFRGRLEWHPDSMVTLMLRPRASLNNTSGWNENTSATFTDDPYRLVNNPLDLLSVEQLEKGEIIVNRRTQKGTSESNSTDLGTRAELNWKLNPKGRNITLSENAGYTNGDNKTTTLSEIIYYQTQEAKGENINRRNETPTKNWNSATKFTYTEPLARKLYLQLGYQFEYRYSKSDRTTFDFDVYNEKLSTFSEYMNYIHTIDLMLRFVRDKYKLNAGVMFQPQTSRLKYRGFGKNETVDRSVQNLTPTMDLRFTPNKVTQLRLEYRGWTGQPSMTNLLEITDDSDPLNITMGNSGLKPSFTNDLRGHFNTFLENHQQSIMSFLNYSNTRNAVTNRVEYNDNGGRTTKPVNVNGNWNVNWGAMYNTSIDSAGVWNMHIFTMLSHNNYVGYVLQDKQTLKSNTRSTMLMPKLQASFRKDWIELAADGNFTYTHSVSDLQSQGNLDTWQFTYGGSLNIYAPWGTSISTDLHNQSRRGYSDSSMNTNELIWNVQVSQSMLKGKALTLSLQMYDILKRQSSYSRSISALQRVDTEDRIAINSYAMIKATYRFNFLGGKKAREKMESQFPGPPPGMTRGGVGGKRPMGSPPPPRW